MKRLYCLVLAVMLCCISTALATEIDLVSMSDEELGDLITSAQEELGKRSDEVDSNIMIYDENGIKVYLTRNYSFRSYENGDYFCDFECVLENNSSQDVTLSVPYSSINGWEIGFSPCYRGSNYDFFTASKDKKAKGIICFNLREANAKTYEDIEEIEFTLGIYYDELSIITDEPVLNKRIKLEFKNGVIMYSE